MALARTVFEGTFYFITCAPSTDDAKSACRANPRRMAWDMCPTPRRPDDRMRPNPHTCTCVDRGERSPCRHYQFQSPTQPPKP